MLALSLWDCSLRNWLHALLCSGSARRSESHLLRRSRSRLVPAHLAKSKPPHSHAQSLHLAAASLAPLRRAKACAGRTHRRRRDNVRIDRRRRFALTRVLSNYGLSVRVVAQLLYPLGLLLRFLLCGLKIKPIARGDLLRAKLCLFRAEDVGFAWRSCCGRLSYGRRGDCAGRSWCGGRFGARERRLWTRGAIAVCGRVQEGRGGAAARCWCRCP